MARKSSTPQQTSSAAEAEGRTRSRRFGLASFQLLGRMADVAELRYTSTGRPVSRVCVAYNDHTGHVHYLDVTVWNGAEALVTYGQKGRALVVTGRLATRRWQTEDGSHHKVVELVADEFHFADRPAQNGAEAPDEGEPAVGDTETAV